MQVFRCSLKMKNRLGVEEDIISVLRENGLRWCWHVLRKDDGDWVRTYLAYKV